ncbi:uncharacterized protein MONBRDRAFT_7153 [Monosiga brevicollis MX1]|uniref:Uncharacterized protein n=1 Tax=Monosiga brevicollis TaxID=81824 RepID=A9UW34_MONBE|nr:uncharacterized protein MONBRDRAFT_7153 [Monosiga brevicollis MX1]EDQ90698.1 predicted protein [Monosiga brevicollis MX1]|eukprot:XP_001744749.1 hypothetical protein [Monosiga brevicollis MX1]
MWPRRAAASLAARASSARYMTTARRGMPRVVSVDKIDEVASAVLRPDSRIVTAMAVSEPYYFYHNIHRWLEMDSTLTDLKVYCANPNEPVPIFADKNLGERIHFTTMFLNHAIRHLQGRRVSYMPHHLSTWSENILRAGPINVFWGSCTPPQENGYVSLGPGCVYETDIMRKADVVILEVNPNIPYVHGSPVIPIESADILIDGCTAELQKLPKAEYDDIDMIIARYVADLIPDEATIQFGIGGIPNALGDALLEKRDLGVHTEMINDCLMKLFQSGVVTGKYKSRYPERMVGSFALGTQDLYDFMNDNPGVFLVPGRIVNSMEEFSRQHMMHSINTCVELDLTGQIVSESVGHRQLSGVGGAADTHVAAQKSPGGRSIIAVRSTSKNGQSKIVSQLQAGAKISISRNDVDTVITEYGVAPLKGLSVQERVVVCICLAGFPFSRFQLHLACCLAIARPRRTPGATICPHFIPLTH